MLEQKHSVNFHICDVVYICLRSFAMCSEQLEPFILCQSAYTYKAKASFGWKFTTVLLLCNEFNKEKLTTNSEGERGTHTHIQRDVQYNQKNIAHAMEFLFSLHISFVHSFFIQSCYMLFLRLSSFAFYSKCILQFLLYWPMRLPWPCHLLGNRGEISARYCLLNLFYCLVCASIRSVCVCMVHVYYMFALRILWRGQNHRMVFCVTQTPVARMWEACEWE